MSRPIATLLAVLTASAALGGCEKAKVDPRTQMPLVAVATLEATGDTGQSFTGVVRARIESDLGFRSTR